MEWAMTELYGVLGILLIFFILVTISMFLTDKEYF